MDSREFIRRFLGFPRNPPNPHFSEDRCPEDGRDGDDGLSLFFGDSSSRGLEGMFEHFHGDMWRQMGALHQQMEEMMRGFGAIDFHTSVELPSVQPWSPSDTGKPDSDKVFSWSYIPNPFFKRGEKRSPRDFMLKDGADDELPGRPTPPAIADRSKFEGVVPAVPFTIRGSQNREDTDLDGKISEDKLLEMIQQPKPKQVLDKPHVFSAGRSVSVLDKPHVFSAGRSVSVSTFRGPDHKIEHKRTVRDSSGREESTITRTIGDKSYTITTVTDKNGSQQRHEAFKNMDETEVSKFEDEWKKKKQVPPSMLPSLSGSVAIDDKSLFTRLFDWKDQ